MENSVLQRFKDGILTQRQNIFNWFKGAPLSARMLRIGPAGEQAVENRLQTIDAILHKVEENTLGKCEVCHEEVELSRIQMDYSACVCLEHLTGEERTRLENDLELSQKVQQALLPHSVPRIYGLDVAAFSQPAHIVGGDYFDFLQFKDGAHGIVIADVMGKGMPASLLMASLQTSLRILTPENLEPAQVMRRLNHIFCHNIQLTKFVTIFLARYEEKQRKFTYCNAGHNPPLVLRSNGSIETLMPTSAAIGLIEQTTFEERSIALSVNDRLLMYTDGVVEAQNADGNFYEQARLEEFLHRSYQLHPQQIISSLRQQLQQFTGSTTWKDDTTIIAALVNA